MLNCLLFTIGSCVHYGMLFFRVEDREQQITLFKLSQLAASISAFRAPIYLAMAPMRKALNRAIKLNWLVWIINSSTFCIPWFHPSLSLNINFSSFLFQCWPKPENQMTVIFDCKIMHMLAEWLMADARLSWFALISSKPILTKLEFLFSTYLCFRHKNELVVNKILDNLMKQKIISTKRFLVKYSKTQIS